jgi:hypothetical protein
MTVCKAIHGLGISPHTVSALLSLSLQSIEVGLGLLNAYLPQLSILGFPRLALPGKVSNSPSKLRIGSSRLGGALEGAGQRRLLRRYSLQVIHDDVCGDIVLSKHHGL